VNRIYLKPEHSAALAQDAERMGVNPTDVLDVILLDFFHGWKPEDRPKFYRQAGLSKRTVVMAPEVANRIKNHLIEEARFLDGLNSVASQREAGLIRETIEQL